MPNGAEMIATERQRQVEAEGWTFEHDDEHEDEEMALVATWLLAPQRFKKYVDYGRDSELPPSYWVLRITGNNVPPWGVLAKKQTRIEALTKAGALIAAEIDRLQRAEKPDARAGGA